MVLFSLLLDQSPSCLVSGIRLVMSCEHLNLIVRQDSSAFQQNVFIDGFLWIWSVILSFTKKIKDKKLIL